ncbi:TPA: hypothetical protein N0F65_002126 [Lagenidium giganteum]|uniref:Uncharacterized protein n=1 Tax=Lagenidium giganteum TaxID=4803 RepID=A0AAV2ZHN8_9STRA|nr:TPA: hypothetical protein N0F65_002126 [Lagenidium giganteum]
MNPSSKAEGQRFAEAIRVEGQDEWLQRFTSNLV